MKKSIRISNLTLDLWLEYVRPAARAAGILEEVPARDDWHEYTAEVIDEAAADEIAHCMYCACINSHIENGDYTSDGEARQMLYQLVSMKYDLRHTAEVITLLYNALSATLNPETIEEKQEENTMTTIDKVAAELEAQKDRSAWGRGVNAYALELVEELRERAAYEGRNPEPGKECREWRENMKKGEHFTKYYRSEQDGYIQSYEEEGYKDMTLYDCVKYMDAAESWDRIPEDMLEYVSYWLDVDKEEYTKDGVDNDDLFTALYKACEEES